MPLRTWTAEDDATFLELQGNGATCREIAAAMGRTLEATRSRSKRLRSTPGRKFVRSTLEFALARLASEVVEDPATGCLIWQGGKNGVGYGEVRVEARSHLTHRLAYETAKGPIPEGLMIDHLCRRRACINPEHLEPVTHAENLRRGRRAECIRGHPRTDDNIYVSPGKGLRQCRECNRIRQRVRRERRRG